MAADCRTNITDHALWPATRRAGRAKGVEQHTDATRAGPQQRTHASQVLLPRPGVLRDHRSESCVTIKFEACSL